MRGSAAAAYFLHKFFMLLRYDLNGKSYSVMHVVAIYGLKEDKESRAGILARSLGVTELEALSRLRAPGSGPVIVRIFADRDPAGRLAGQLESGGFHTVVLGSAEIEAEAGRLMARRFALDAQQLQVGSTDGGKFAVACRDIEVILRGTGITTRTETETTKKRSLSLGMAVLTGGLIMTKTTKTVREITTGEREGFLAVYAGDGSIFDFRENLVSFESLGPQMKQSRSENFSYLAAELRRRCPGAAYDERLLSRAGQAALLGPTLSPEKHIDVATALLAKVLRGRPGRH